jgi:long-chain acyl-CoA synthetase
LRFALADSGSRMLFADGERHARLVDRLSELPALQSAIVSRPEREAGAGAMWHLLDDVIGPSSDWAALPARALPAVEIAPDDDATLFYTSGTTGRPKGALGTHRNLCSNILSSGYTAARAILRRGDTPPAGPVPKATLMAIPLFHVTGCSAGMMNAVAAGSSMHFLRRWDPLAAMALIEREGVQSTGGVPTIAWQMLEHPERHRFDLSSLETMHYGGAPAAPELARRIHAEFGAWPGNGWGMTETMATVTQHGGEEYLARPTSCGPPVPVAELSIRDPESGEALPTGMVGELWAKGPMVVKGYWNRPEESARCFVDGWVRTGDLARIDADGFLHIVDRLKDVIIRGGENIYSSEVEDALYAWPGVTDAAVIGVPHPTLGEEPVAVVHLAPGASASETELRDWVRARLAGFKVPVAIRFSADTLPRNANGKILKDTLRMLFAAD